MSRVLHRLERLEHKWHARIQSMIDALSDEDCARAEIEFAFYRELQRLDELGADVASYEGACARAFAELGDPSQPGSWPFLPLMTVEPARLCRAYGEWFAGVKA